MPGKRKNNGKIQYGSRSIRKTITVESNAVIMKQEELL
jgi:hypothetical protein